MSEPAADSVARLLKKTVLDRGLKLTIKNPQTLDQLVQAITAERPAA